MIFGPYFGLKTDRRESSTIRSKTSLISKGFRISGLTIDNKSSIGYRGGSGSIILGLVVRTCNEATHSRAFEIASNLIFIHVSIIYNE